MEENYLIHYGVKGMKWGVRKKEDEPVGKGPIKAKKDESTGNGPRKTKADTDEPKKVKSAFTPKFKLDKINNLDDEIARINSLNKLSDKEMEEFLSDVEERYYFSRDDIVKRVKKMDKNNKYSDEDITGYINLHDDYLSDLYPYFSEKFKKERVKEIFDEMEYDTSPEGIAERKESDRIARRNISILIGTVLAGTIGATAVAGITIANKIKKNKK